MFTDEVVQQVSQAVSAAHSVFVVVNGQAKFDQVAAALGLAEGLRQLGKDVSLLSPVSLAGRENLSGLRGLENFTQQIGNQNLQMSFAYVPDQVDKVSYNIDEESHKFYLIIQPKKGVAPLDEKAVEFTHTGANVDLVFTVGVTNLESLEQLYIGFESVFTETPLVALHAFDTTYGMMKLNTAGYTGLAEGAARLLNRLGASLNPGATLNLEAAEPLLAGIEVTTDDFRSSAMSAETFELVAQLLRAGAKRLPASTLAQVLGPRESMGAPAGAQFGAPRLMNAQPVTRVTLNPSSESPFAQALADAKTRISSAVSSVGGGVGVGAQGAQDEDALVAKPAGRGRPRKIVPQLMQQPRSEGGRG